MEYQSKYPHLKIKPGKIKTKSMIERENILNEILNKTKSF